MSEGNQVTSGRGRGRGGGGRGRARGRGRGRGRGGPKRNQGRFLPDQRKMVYHEERKTMNRYQQLKEHEAALERKNRTLDDEAPAAEVEEEDNKELNGDDVGLKRKLESEEGKGETEAETDQPMTKRQRRESRKKQKLYGPYQKARKQYELEASEKAAKREAERVRLEELRTKRKKKREVSRKLQKRTRKGQPIMANMMDELLSRIQDSSS
eukprot:TRINITY_DN4665_c0_g1_i1.p1 TRINITY_DN4665_c0_g1~~TRINITY_DN4665_c0_g1_i1.p1  ORF type:complete len:211 (+),score=65.96 TRINITY_DN4665_c0_g1_i1:1-633(+)